MDSFRNQTNCNVGLPLGNVAPQIFVNVYLHELGNFIKRDLHQKHYLRYCNDFDEAALMTLFTPIRKFLAQRSHFTLHPEKIILSTTHHGIYFLGYIAFLHHQLFQKRTKIRVQRRPKSKYDGYLHQAIYPTHVDQ